MSEEIIKEEVKQKLKEFTVPIAELMGMKAERVLGWVLIAVEDVADKADPTDISTAASALGHIITDRDNVVAYFHAIRRASTNMSETALKMDNLELAILATASGEEQ